MLFDKKWEPRKEDIPPIFRNDLTTNEIKYLLKVRTALKRGGEISSKQFRMDTIHSNIHCCGTVGCIGGWMAMFTLMDKGYDLARIDADMVMWTAHGSISHNDAEFAFNITMNSHKFHKLFYDYDTMSTGYGHTINKTKGIQAIDRFLAGYYTPWDFHSNLKIPGEYLSKEPIHA